MIKNVESGSPHVIAISGGKGGVGKTSIAINLAIALSKTGSKVCLFDGDTSLANTNVMLGLYPAYTLEHLFTGERSIQDIVINGPEGIQIVPGASGVAQCVELDVGQQQRLVTSMRAIERHYDYLLVDTAAGIGTTVLHFIAASQVAIIVITPEPTSLTDAFSLLKVLKRRGYRRKAQIVVNMATNPGQAKKAFNRFSQAVQKYLSLRTEYLGCVWMDESMRNAVVTQKPVTLFPKHDPSARCFYRLAEAVEAIFERPGTPSLAFSAYWQKVVERQPKRSQTPSTHNVPRQQDEGGDEPLTQVQRQLRAKVQQALEAPAADSKQHASLLDRSVNNEPKSAGLRAEDENIRVENENFAPYVSLPSDKPADSTSSDDTSIPLNADSENAWLDLRVRMNRFASDPNTTPEQIVTLLSGVLYGVGDRLGHAAVDLVHGLLHALDPDTLTAEQKQLLLSDYERLGLDSASSRQENRLAKARYDARGFGDQQALVQAIRSSAADVPLESLLESIKYASLIDSGSDK